MATKDKNVTATAQAASEQDVQQVAAQNEQEPSNQARIGADGKRIWTEEELNEYVEITLFKDGDKYVDDVLWAINNESGVIPRGVPCKVKRKVALMLENTNAAVIAYNKNLASIAAKSENL